MPILRPFLPLTFAALLLAAADAPEQPLPFSHKTHAGAMKMACKTCHTNPDPGDSAGIPPASACMQCHSAVQTDSPAIRKLAAYAVDRRPVPWVRLYEIPDWVQFNHRTHTRTGSTCEDCHGRVAESDRLAREGNISMTGCVNCHKAKSAGVACGFCHEPR